jgi:type II secretory pathway component PulM
VDTTRFSAFWGARSSREKLLISLAVSFLSSVVLWPAVVTPISEAFARQSRELEDISLTYSAAPDILARYAKLTARRKELENFYSGVDLASEPLSYLERLLKETAKVAGAYNVTPRDGVQLGSKYAHKIFLVNFQTSSTESLAAFLKELTTGAQPMLVSMINLDKRSSAGTLNVQLEVSGFEALRPE